MPRKRKSRAERNIKWIEDYCHIPDGNDLGKKVRLLEFQKDIIRKIYDNEVPTRRAFISMGRKNAKTTLCAFLLLLHLVGPERRINSQLYSAATSREQASLIFDMAVRIIRMSPVLNSLVAIKETNKILICPSKGTKYRALSAEAKTAYGLNPVFIVHDELGQVRGSRSPLFDALETATGAQTNPLSICISTQAPTDGDLFSILIDDALKKGDPRVAISLYTAPHDLDPFSEEAIQAANPALGHFLNQEEVLAMAEDARRMPSREGEYRNLVLNQRVEMDSPFISRSLWESCAGLVTQSDFEGPIHGGLDLSATTDLTALVLVSSHHDKLYVRPTFWLPKEGLAERSRNDRITYDVWNKQGYLQTTPGKAIDYDYIAEHIRGLFDDFDIQSIAFDRWGFDHLIPCLERAGFSAKELDKFKQFGQGFRSMSPALRILETAILNNRLVHDGNPVLSMCIANATVSYDPAAQRKLDKIKSHGRIDGAVALAMGVSQWQTADPPKQPRKYQVFFMK